MFGLVDAEQRYRSLLAITFPAQGRNFGWVSKQQNLLLKSSCFLYKLTLTSWNLLNGKFLVLQHVTNCNTFFINHVGKGSFQI